MRYVRRTDEHGMLYATVKLTNDLIKALEVRSVLVTPAGGRPSRSIHRTRHLTTAKHSYVFTGAIPVSNEFGRGAGPGAHDAAIPRANVRAGVCVPLHMRP